MVMVVMVMKAMVREIECVHTLIRLTKVVIIASQYGSNCCGVALLNILPEFTVNVHYHKKRLKNANHKPPKTGLGLIIYQIFRE